MTFRHFVRQYSLEIARALAVCVTIPFLFFQDWWNSTSYSNYYRTWNVVVHDWLYYYAYKDLLWVNSKT